MPSSFGDHVALTLSEKGYQRACAKEGQDPMITQLQVDRGGGRGWGQEQVQSPQERHTIRLRQGAAQK